MTRRRLRLYDPRIRVKSETGVRVSRPTLSWLEEVRAWILQELWSNRELRPPQWGGKLSHDEALRLVLRAFCQAYGVPLNTDKRGDECDQES